uniref:Penicillin amidase n=1 Tax=Solibacter usitatus (strain Ellin6076) TaxID=234267 RepID=Q02BF5_SOLUE
MRRQVLALLLLTTAAAARGPVTIYRDTYGVPHIYGKTDADAAFGLMYAQAEDNFWQLEEDYIRLLGRAAEIEGPRGLNNDILVRAYEATKHAKDHYAHGNAKVRALCDAFAAGVNAYIKQHPEKPRLIRQWEPWFILMEEHRGPAGTGITAAERARAFPSLAGPTSDTGTPEDPDEGSNMWAVAPSRTTTRHAMLLINPHVGFFGGGQRYEAHLHSGEGLDVSGFAILGTPYIRSGRNRYLGWSHTNNYASTADVYLEKFDDPSDPLSYRYGNGRRKAVEWSEEIPVKTASGMEEWRVTFRKTHHGPILGMRPGVGLAVRSAATEGGVMEQRWAMAKARNLREFQAALARITLTGSNTIYADVAGNIYYLHGNAIPKRSVKFDWSKPVDGSDPETEWQGLHALADLPQVLNPRSGWLQNCNSTPFLTSGPDDNPAAARYPAYMAPEPDTPRSQRSRAILAGDHRFTFAEWTKLGLDTKIGIAAQRVPELLAEFAKLPPADAAKVADLVAEIRDWDQVGRNDSVATTLFVRTATLARSGGQIAALEQVKAALEAAWGTWKVPWGDVNRLQRVHTSGTEEQFSDARPSVPVPGAPSFTGTIFTFGTREVPGQKRMYGTVGDTYVSVVDFGKRPEAHSLLVLGESADRQSEHYADQAALYSTQHFKPAWFELGDIRKHTERKYKVIYASSAK